MGLRTGGCYAKVWKVEPKERYTKIQCSISKKVKNSDQYETDWSGFMSLVGGAHTKASNLKEGDRIKINEFEVTTRYVKDKGVTYTNYTLFDFEIQGNNQQQSKPAPDEPVELSEDDLPF